MEFQKTHLDGVLIAELDTFEDFRGQYVEIFNKEIYAKNGVKIDFIQDDISVSTRHVLRGIHGDPQTWKLVSCLYGSFYLVVVNNDQNSPQYKKWQGFTLSDRNRKQILIPPNFGNGHVVMSEQAIFHYKQNTYYDPASQFTIKWNDPDYKIWWPIENPILSRRDTAGQFVD